MQILQNINVDWVGKRKLYLVISATLLLVSLASLFFVDRGGPRLMRGLPLGVDFRGGTLVYVKFNQTPDEERIRQAVQQAGINDARIQRYGPASENQVIISVEQASRDEEALTRGREQIVSVLSQNFGTGFEVRNVEVVGPQVGEQLQQAALLAVAFASAGMLVYLWFRFELIYGAASIAAVLHDVIITLGIFSLLNVEISLTVIAAMLTLIGYSMNDTIVIFDRVRENLKLLRRERLPELVNISINQTLSRTVLTSGLTFLTVLSLYLFGGEVLHGFSLALVIGILLGTYSTIAVAAPLLVVYQEWRGTRGRTAPVPAAANRRDKVRA